MFRGKVNIKYDQEDPGVWWIGYGAAKTLDIRHNHPEKYDTSYLYETHYTPQRAGEINNEINQNSATLKGCMTFFKSMLNSPNYPVPQAAARALAEDEVKLRSLTEKTFYPAQMR